MPSRPLSAHGLLPTLRSFSPSVLRSFPQYMGSQLGVTCLLLFFGALAAGAVPLCAPVSDSQLGFAAALSAGLLIGAGLSVVIPEGFESFHEALTAFDTDRIPDGLAGAALVLGFLAMLLLDQLQGDVHQHGKHIHMHTSSSEEDLEAPLSARSSLNERPPASGLNLLKGGLDHGSRALIGLLIHSLADGLAVGAAVHGGNAKLGTAVAFAMVLHKVPAALGLTTFLIAARWPRRKAMNGLVAFAAAAPLAAILTTLLLALSPFLSHPLGAALCVIFSGGTFLYAACVHVLPEARHAGPGNNLSRVQAGALVLGSLLPLSIPFFSAHH